MSFICFCQRQFKCIKTKQEQKKRRKGHQISSTRPGSQCVRFKIIEVFSSRVSWLCLFWCLCLVLKKALFRNSYILSTQTMKIKNAWNWRNEPEGKCTILAENPGFMSTHTAVHSCLVTPGDRAPSLASSGFWKHIYP